MFRHVLAAVVAAAGSSASAQPVGAAAPTIDYRSAFDGYNTWRDEPLRDWRKLNDDMRRLGGHAGHLRGAPEPTGTTPPERTPSKPTAPAQPAHSHGDAAPARAR